MSPSMSHGWIEAPNRTRMSRLRSTLILRALLNAISQTSNKIKADTSDTVMEKFIAMLRNAGPKVQNAVAVLTPYVLLLTALSTYSWLRQPCLSLVEYVTDCLSASVVIPENPLTLYDKILRWMVTQGLGEKVRKLAVTAPMSFIDGEDEDNKLPWVYVPDEGTYTFIFEGTRLTLKRYTEHRPETPGSRASRENAEEKIKISCWSPFSGTKVIRRFLDHVKQSVDASMELRTTIFRPNKRGWSWTSGVQRPKRDLKAVTLEPGLKEQLVHDIDAYLNPRTRMYYSNRGIPWRRGFLFYGPPGTGKTSFTTALAGHFNLDIYMINLASKRLNDDRLDTLFGLLPAKCFVLLEDIDSAGIRREDMQNTKRAKPLKKPTSFDWEGNPENDDPDGITLSGLLNVLDGVHAVEGRIVVMTSNKPDSLDEALIRRGRIDQKVLFGYATQAVSALLFERIFCKTKDELLDDEKPKDHKDIAVLAKAFAERTPEEKLTPAEVQGFLLDNRQDPHEAVAKVGAYAEAILANRARGANVASFSDVQPGTTSVYTLSNTPSSKNLEESDKKTHDDSSGEGSYVNVNDDSSSQSSDT